MANPAHRPRIHAYPDDLAALVRRRWAFSFEGESFLGLPVYASADALPPAARLRELLSDCYQASLLREEGRAVRFRLILCDAAKLARVHRCSGIIQIVPFLRPFALTPNELRRLAAAAAFEHALIGAQLQPDGSCSIWGIAHSGVDWVRALEGAKRTFDPLPPSLVVAVTGPGNLSVGKGSIVVARLVGGRVSVPTSSVLEASTKASESEAINSLFLAAHFRDRHRRGRCWGRVSPALVGVIRRQIALRLVTAMRRLHHGGTLLVLPLASGRERRRWRTMLDIKYGFKLGDARTRLFRLTLRLFEALAEDAGQRFGPDHQVSWQDYLSSTSAKVLQVDEAITESIRFIASLSAVDGAVVMVQPLELLGFGAEISGRLEPVHKVARALDSAAARTELESTHDVGTRHRSAYRICNAMPGAVAIVVSQDGSVRILKRAGNRVVYSQHLGTGVLDV